jgi:hypothetical protein
MDDFEDLAVEGFTVKEELPQVVEYNKSEKTQSGYCNKCHKRYQSAPVVDGIVLCPTCNA